MAVLKNNVLVPRALLSKLVGVYKSEMEGTVYWEEFVKEWGTLLRRKGYKNVKGPR